jgi:hypothetical protein
MVRRRSTVRFRKGAPQNSRSSRSFCSTQAALKIIRPSSDRRSGRPLMTLSHMNWPATTGRASPTERDVEQVWRLERTADGVRNMESFGMGVSCLTHLPTSLRSAAAWVRTCWPPPTASGIASRPPTPVRPALLRVGGRELSDSGIPLRPRLLHLQRRGVEQFGSSLGS